MLSRVADSIYWMSRYVERCENLARFVEVTFTVMLDLPGRENEQWLPLISTTGDSEWFEEHYGIANRDNVVKFLTFDMNYGGSILASLRAARENARSVRDAIPSEVWELLNQFYYRVKDASKDPSTVLQSPLEFYNDNKWSSHLFKGTLDASMSHEEGWHFAQLGRYLERADKTTRMVDVQYYRLLPHVHDVGTPLDDLQWSALLHTVSGFEMYRKRYHQITPQRVVSFLILDRFFPRAVMHCIDSANLSLHAISGSSVDSFCNLAEQRMGRLRNELAFMRTEEIISMGLHEFVDSLQTKMNKIGDAIFHTFIAIDPETDAA